MSRLLLLLKSYSVNFLVAGIAFVIGLLIIEGLARIFYDPVNFFKPELIPDEILRHKLVPGSGGHDAWGYRNEEVPDSVTIVAIGDSQTYGISADSQDSWPHQLGDLLDEKVYNLSLGGYGPVQYAYMLENQALTLKPRSIITGFYLGNDLYDSYHMAYKQEYWRSLRDPALQNIGDTSKLYDIVFTPKPTGFLLKRWLANNSMVYNMVFVHSFIGDYIRGKRNIEKVQGDSTLTLFNDKKDNVSATFLPSMRLYSLNLDDKKIKEGLRISLDRLLYMDSLCKSKNIDFMVVIIPTKEMVYAPYLENNSELRNASIIEELLQNEQKVTDLTTQFFNRHQIKYVEVANDMTNAIGDNIYPNDSDGHPNKKGYGIIASRIRKELKP